MKRNLFFILTSVAMYFYAAGNLCAQTLLELQDLQKFLVQESGIIPGPYKDAQPFNYFCVSGSTVNVAAGKTPMDDTNFKMLKENTGTGWFSALKGITVEAGHITGIYWSNMANTYIPHINTEVSGCGGVLDLKNCKWLERLVCDNSKLKELYLDGTSLVGPVNVMNNSLTKFVIDNPMMYYSADGIIPTFAFPDFDPDPNKYGNTFNCSGNKLKFNFMPKVEVLDDDMFMLNLYVSNNQADSVNLVGNEIGTPIDLQTDYFFNIGTVSSYAAGMYGTIGTTYNWKYTSNNNSLSPQPANVNGMITFTNPSVLNGVTSGVGIYCEMKNNFFSGTTLIYKTTLYPAGSIPTGISDPSAFTASAYFAGDALYVKSEVPIRAVSVFDLSGKELYAGGFNENNITIDGLGSQKGIYIVKVTSDAGVVKRKVLK